MVFDRTVLFDNTTTPLYIVDEDSELLPVFIG